MPRAVRESSKSFSAPSTCRYSAKTSQIRRWYSSLRFQTGHSLVCCEECDCRVCRVVSPMLRREYGHHLPTGNAPSFPGPTPGRASAILIFITQGVKCYSAEIPPLTEYLYVRCRTPIPDERPSPILRVDLFFSAHSDIPTARLFLQSGLQLRLTGLELLELHIVAAAASCSVWQAVI